MHSTPTSSASLAGVPFGFFAKPLAGQFRAWFYGATPVARPSGWTFRPLKRRFSPE